MFWHLLILYLWDALFNKAFLVKYLAGEARLPAILQLSKSITYKSFVKGLAIKLHSCKSPWKYLLMEYEF